MLKSPTLNYTELQQFSLKEDLVNNGYSLFAEEVISRPQYAEEFIKSFQFSLVTTLSRFWVSQGKESLCAKQKSSRISLINSSWPELWKMNTSLCSEFIFHNSCHLEFICHKSWCLHVCTDSHHVVSGLWCFTVDHPNVAEELKVGL